jgi:acyl-[acyl-carrier-protein]-phospholipid O-acyltransferase / long-chain-fatty-acid--[acyl-carrier-protein] ligase
MSGVGSRAKTMSVQTTERPVAADLAVADVALPPLPTAWRSLPRAFLDTARSQWSKIGMADSTGVSLTYGSALVRALALGRALVRELGPEPYVGLMVPPTVPGAISNIALLMFGKVPINLNYSASQAVIDAGVDQAGIKYVITSKKVVEKLHLKPKGTLVYLEDMPAKVSKLDKIWAAAVAKIVPAGLLGSFLPGFKNEKLDATATVMFTSGSTGEPKGVVLSHGNILNNVHQMRHHLELDPLDVVALGILPFFHSFGFTVGIWTILLLGKKAVYHSNPLESKIIGDLCEKHKVTLIAASPTFARHYIQRKPEQYATLYHLLLGAEKLQSVTAQEIRDKIHLEPLEGYGTTEMSPVAAVNVPFDVTLPDGRKVSGNRVGTVGRPLPGTAIKTIDPETGADLPRGTEGMILVKGPQIMQGYLNRPDATAKVLKDGWYNSGDLGYLDPDGFLKITGRLSRFSKIAGEMVPHLGVESALMEAAGVDEMALAVTAVPDDKRQERLVVIHAKLPIGPAEICKKLLAAGLPKLWVPSAEDFIQVEAVPRLGPGGKLDLRKLKEIALEREKTDT